MLFSSQRAEKARHSHSTWSYIHGQRSRTSIATQLRTHTQKKNVHVPIGKLNRGQERCMKLKQPLGWPTTLALNERDEIPKSKWIKFKSMNFFTWLYVAHISIQADSLRWYWKTLKLNSRFDCVCVLCSVAYVAVYQIYASGRRRMKRRKKNTQFICFRPIVQCMSMCIIGVAVCGGQAISFQIDIFVIFTQLICASWLR